MAHFWQASQIAGRLVVRAMRRARLAGPRWRRSTPVDNDGARALSGGAPFQRIAASVGGAGKRSQTPRATPQRNDLRNRAVDAILRLPAAGREWPTTRHV